VPVCTNCAQQISETAHFCPNCGSSISAAPVAQPRLTPPSSLPAALPRAAAAASPARDKNFIKTDITAGLPDNIAGMLAYFIVPAVVFLLIQPFKRNRFVRFHSFQCLITVAVLILFQIALALFGKLMPLFVLSLYGLLLLGEITVWLLLLFKAYKNEAFKLPVVGDIAEMLADKN
jgi:uncharacterized membrane protein